MLRLCLAWGRDVFWDLAFERFPFRPRCLLIASTFLTRPMQACHSSRQLCLLPSDPDLLCWTEKVFPEFSALFKPRLTLTVESGQREEGQRIRSAVRRKFQISNRFFMPGNIIPPVAFERLQIPKGSLEIIIFAVYSTEE